MKYEPSPKSQEFDGIPIVEKVYEKVDPIILTEPHEGMDFTKNIIMVYQYPPDDKLFVPTYISGDYQTHYGIYRLEDNKMKLLFEKLHIVFDGLVFYYIDRDITNYLYNLGLNKHDIKMIKDKKFKI